jgi:hypothetical protein
MIIGPPPKFHGTRDILGSWAALHTAQSLCRRAPVRACPARSASLCCIDARPMKGFRKGGGSGIRTQGCFAAPAGS